jgi:hypothetical protein
MPDKDPGDLVLFVKWMDFLTWLFAATEKFPKKTRFVLVNRIDNLALDVVEDLVEARYTRDRLPILRRTNLKLEKLRVLLRISHDQGHLPHRGYEHSARALDEAGRMIGGWIRRKIAAP